MATPDPPSISFFGNTPLNPSRALAASSFLASDESISIIPSFNYAEPMGLIFGSVGPFRAGMDTVVPLWLATMLRRRKLAKIVPPEWMDVETLKEVLRFERDPKEASFSPLLPFRHAEIARAILSACRAGSGTGSAAGDGGDSEVPNADQVKLLLEDIATVRMDKIRRNVHTLSSQTLTKGSRTESIIDVTNIGSLEMHAIKPFVTEAFRMHRELLGKGTSYSQPLEGGGAAVAGAGADGDGEGEGRSGRTTGGRLKSSRLVRESEETTEELMEPRPLEEMGENNDMDDQEDEENEAGRSRIRRHR
eukprot:g5835.t1 g5835   contig20:260052-260969(+)